MKNKNLRFEVVHEEGWYSARCLDAAIITQARTLNALERNIREAVNCHFDESLEKAKKFHPIISLEYTLPVHA